MGIVKVSLGVVWMLVIAGLATAIARESNATVETWLWGIAAVVFSIAVLALVAALNTAGEECLDRLAAAAIAALIGAIVIAPGAWAAPAALGVLVGVRLLRRRRGAPADAA